MKKSGFIYPILCSGLILLFFSLTNCHKSEDPIKYPHGTFPDSIFNISNINSPYDDYNMSLPQLSGELPLIFSSNRKSAGAQFDLEQGKISFVFDQTTGSFDFTSQMTSDPFLTQLINKASTSGNDFGPYRLFSTIDGYEYLILASVNATGNLDLYYLKNQPVAGSIIPDITGPLPVKLMNTNLDDCYLVFNFSQDTAYFSSATTGKFDIYFLKKPAAKNLTDWFNGSYEVPVKLESLNSTADDKCPYIYKNIMLFTSNRPGGFGGYDLYYSILKNGKWSSPVNMGPGINTSSNEYRPVIGAQPDFTNEYLIFSSDRPGGKGGFDLYFTGLYLPPEIASAFTGTVPCF
jgi:hypothetical protein